MHVEHLSVTDFRSYPSAELALRPGVTVLLGGNGNGKTNLLEAVGYVATLASHRVAADAPLVRAGADRAVIRARIRRGERVAGTDIQISRGAALRVLVNRTPVPRPRRSPSLLRAVAFAPEDLALVRGDPDGRRRFLDDLLVARSPRYAGVRADYERVVRQRGALLRSVRTASPSSRAAAAATLDVWDAHLADFGADLLHGRLATLAALRPHAVAAYAEVSGQPGAAAATYVPRGLGGRGARDEGEDGTGDAPGDGAGPAGARTGDAGEGAGSGAGTGPEGADRDELHAALVAAAAERRPEEIERGACLVGPHRDEVLLEVNGLPARGYASHGEAWSVALALRLGSFDLLRAEGDDDAQPVLVLDDVFAELDADRRRHLVRRAAEAEQALVSAAVGADVPAGLGAEVVRIERDPHSGASRIAA